MAKIRSDNSKADGAAEYVIKYANKEDVDDAGEESGDDDALSSVGSLGDEEVEAAGKMDDV